MVVVEVGETRVFAPKVDGKPPSKKTEVRLINDEEEQLKLCVWGDQGHEVRKQLVVGGVGYSFFFLLAMPITLNLLF